MNERALSFGAVARAYEQHRPGYPEEIVDLVVDHAEGEVARALEVGAGTGKATAVFAARGIEVLAVEPDAGMCAVLEQQTAGLPVQVVASTFESLDLRAVGTVDLVYAAAAFHWTEPATRWQTTASLLRPGGVAAFFGGPYALADPGLDAEVERIAAAVIGEDGARDPYAPDLGDDLRWPGSDMLQVPELTDVTETVLPRRRTVDADDFVAYLATVSVFVTLPAERRTAVLGSIRSALPDQIEVVQDLTVHLARRV